MKLTWCYNSMKYLKQVGVLLTSMLVFSLSGCGEELIKPNDKQVLAMIQFEMPDYDSTKENAVVKVKRWMQSRADTATQTVTFKSVDQHSVKGQGVVTIQTKGKALKVQFDMDVSIIKPTLVKFNAYHFKDLPGPRQGESDITSVFYNQVKKRVLEMTDRLETYLEEDTVAPLSDLQIHRLI